MKHNTGNKFKTWLRGAGITALALATAIGTSSASFAAIDNSAVAVGTHTTADDTTSGPSTQSVPVIPASRDLGIVKSVFAGPTTAAGSDPSNTDGGDTVTFRYTVTNNGNVTETNISVTDAGPTFDGNAGTGTLGSITEVTGGGAGTGTAASIAPGETVVFEAVYTLSQLDVYNAAGVTDGVSNVATAGSDDVPASPPSPPATATIPANPSLVIAKVAVLNDEVTADGNAEATETITYTYTVTNNGNVPLTNVSVTDTHEGAVVALGASGITNETITVEGPVQPSDVGTANDGIIDQLEAGATATFTYDHTVTQTEVDNQ